MLSLFRRRRLPAGARPDLAPEERVLAWAASANDAVVVVTNLGLWLPGVTRSARLGWHEIHKATWSGRALLVVPARVVATHETYTEMVDEDTVSITLLDPGSYRVISEPAAIQTPPRATTTSGAPIEF